MQTLEALQATFTCDGVTFDTSPLGGIVARLAWGEHSAVAALQGAHVLSWRQGPRELLWLSPAARLGTGKAIRGGIPVCWPWFGPHPTDADKPAHGFVRTRIWQVTGTEARGEAVSLRLAISATPDDRALWPHAARAELTITLGETLALSLVTENTSNTPLELTEALHTYFRVGDIGDVAIEGLVGRTYIDKLAGGARVARAGAITFSGEVDRIYVGDTSQITLVDGAIHRLHITSTGSRSAVVWNPWLEKTVRLGDMGAATAFRRMVCIETANAGDDVVTIAAGARHTLTAEYRVA